MSVTAFYGRVTRLLRRYNGSNSDIFGKTSLAVNYLAEIQTLGDAEMTADDRGCRPIPYQEGS